MSEAQPAHIQALDQSDRLNTIFIAGLTSRTEADAWLTATLNDIAAFSRTKSDTSELNQLRHLSTTGDAIQTQLETTKLDADTASELNDLEAKLDLPLGSSPSVFSIATTTEVAETWLSKAILRKPLVEDEADDVLRKRWDLTVTDGVLGSWW